MRRTGEVTSEDERRRIEVQCSGKRQVTLGGVSTQPQQSRAVVCGESGLGDGIGCSPWLRMHARLLGAGRPILGLSLTSLKWNSNKGWSKKPRTDDTVPVVVS